MLLVIYYANFASLRCERLNTEIANSRFTTCLDTVKRVILLCKHSIKHDPLKLNYWDKCLDWRRMKEMRIVRNTTGDLVTYMTRQLLFIEVKLRKSHAADYLFWMGTVASCCTLPLITITFQSYVQTLVNLKVLKCLAFMGHSTWWWPYWPKHAVTLKS
jgi:hypothetical protein